MSALTPIQRGLERLGGVLPTDLRYGLERKVRGYFEHRRLRDCDYAVVSFGKSGRTWLRVLISRLYQQAFDLPQGELLEFDNLHAEDSRVPKIFFTHDNYLRDYTGDGAGKAAFKGRPTVLLVRHPGDVAISQYFQWNHRMRRHKALLNRYPDQNMELTPAEFVLGPSGVQRVVGFMNEWAQHADGSDEVLVVRYEDLRKDTVSTLRQVAGFLNIDGAEAWLSEAVDYASFEKMKKRESEGAGGSDRLTAGDKDNPDSFKTRRAKVGGYQDYLSAEEVQQMLDVIDRTLDPVFGYSTQTENKTN